jgi:hypothetical protein
MALEAPEEEIIDGDVERFFAAVESGAQAHEYQRLLDVRDKWFATTYVVVHPLPTHGEVDYENLES